DNPYVRAHAVWLLALDSPQGISRVAELLKDRNPQTRVVAFRALRRAAEEKRVTANQSPERVPGTHEYFMATARQLASDASPAVRREVAVAMRDISASESQDILVTLARKFDGQDRTYLEAWGTGAKGKESQMYDAIKPALGKSDPTQWSPQFAWLAWRLYPPQSVADFKTRALASSLSDSDRKRALTAIGYNSTQDAADAMLEVAAKTDKTVRAEALWWLLNRKDSTWREFGVNEALKARGVYDPDNVELIEATIPVPEAPKFTAADALVLKGNVKRGEGKFTAACTSCHRVGDTGAEYAPNLTGWAQRQTTEVFLNSVINPSADIASGFAGTEIKTKDGIVLQGLVLSEGDPLIVQSASGMTQTVPKNRIESRKRLERSLMMSADQLGLTAQDLADIQAYLRTK
ncbi:MAG TPA: c-type cytochrome, partial [Verrucomicrobiota bacterium]|nr:c-type cytochrome [Verrucomicrobiota bacterium]